MHFKRILYNIEDVIIVRIWSLTIIFIKRVSLADWKCVAYAQKWPKAAIAEKLLYITSKHIMHTKFTGVQVLRLRNYRERLLQIDVILSIVTLTSSVARKPQAE